MNVSHKLTFSILSIFLLLAFVAVPVMAHAPGSVDNNGVLIGSHTHPVTVLIPAVAADPNTNTPARAEVPIHGDHPTATISVKSGQGNVRGNMVAVIADDAATTDVEENEFTLLVTFNVDVVDAGTQASIADDNSDIANGDLAATDFLFSVLDGNNGTITAPTLDIVRVNDGAASPAITDAGRKQFEITVDSTVFPSGTADAADEELTFRIRLNADTIFSLQKPEILPNGITTVDVPGGGNIQSGTLMLTLVKELPPADVAPDTEKPTVTLGTPEASGGKINFPYTVSETAGKDVLLTEGEIEVENGTAEITDSHIVVTPDSVTSKVTVTVKANAVTDTAGNKSEASEPKSFTPKGYVPTITITSADGTDDDAGKIIFTIDFSEAPASFNVNHITTENAPDLRLTDLMMVDVPDDVDDVTQRYTLTIDPVDDSQAVKVTIKAAVLMTKSGGHSFDLATDSHTLAGAPVVSGKDPTMATIPSLFAFQIPANSYVVLVRNALTTPRQDGLSFRDVPDSKVVVWDNMPDLWERLFDRGYEGGGALVLRSSYGDAAADRPKVGTVGISEIMWAIDVGNYGVYRGTDRTNNRNKVWLDSQWVEVHNLNERAVNVLIYAQTGRDLVGTGNVVGNTQAGDTIHGNPGGMVVDVMTNFFNGSDRGSSGWDIPGANGNSKAGVDFISMARQPKRGSFNLTRRHEDKNDKPLDGLYAKTGGSEQSLDGRASGSWAAGSVIYEREDTDIPAGTTAALPLTYDYLGTPGHPNTRAPASHIARNDRTSVPSNTVIINEVANRNDVFKAYEWIELRNVSGADINLRNYLISIVEAVDSDKVLYQFPANDNAWIAAGGVFLLVASDPSGNPNHPLAAGYNVDKNDEDQVPGTRKNPVRYKVADVGGVPGFGNGRNAGESVKTLPDSGKFVLILRRPDNGEGHRSGADGGKGVAERGKDDPDKIVDIAGWHDNLKKTGFDNAVSSTDLWPLRSFRAPNFSLNSFQPETVHFRQRGAHGLGGVNDAASGVGAHENKNEGGKAAFRDEVYSGIGYKRQASKTSFHGGSPGYHGNVSGRVDATANAAQVIISEIMLSQGNGRVKLPQWIELYNPSKTHAVNLTDNAGWRLVIENPDRAPIRTIHFKSNKHNVKTIQPNETVLIVSSAARDYGGDTLARGTVFPATRVLNAYTVLKGEIFEMASRTDLLVDPKAFNIKLLDGKTTNNKPDGRYVGDISDEIGNLDGNPRTNDAAAWEFPSGITADGDRTSLIRIFDEGVARDGTGEVEPLAGTRGNMPTRMDGVVDMKYSWIHSVDTAGFKQNFVRHTWYGAESDYGTPADRTGQTLPVELSHFRPTLENGEVVIRWTTESELNNAGFNIYRSDTRDGEYKQVNSELIEGAGTTGERNTYKWIDASAKPNVVYYYQIEDVSFAGERQTLQTTKLKGLISARGKATTTWGELKEVQ